MKHSIKRTPALAYILGGLEAFLIQGLFAGILGGALTIKMYWRRIKAYFSGEELVETSTTESDDPPATP